MRRGDTPQRFEIFQSKRLKTVQIELSTLSSQRYTLMAVCSTVKIVHFVFGLTVLRGGPTFKAPLETSSPENVHNMSIAPSEVMLSNLFLRYKR